jgi:restriction system protein
MDSSGRVNYSIGMAIPDYQAYMLPLLRFAEDKQVHRLSEAIDTLADRFKLTKEDRETLLPSGTQFVMANRVGWARTYMKKAGLLTDPKRGSFQITDRGLELLKSDPKEISIATLKRYDEFNEFQRKTNPKKDTEEQNAGHPSYSTPEEALEFGYQKLTENLSDEILERIMRCSPSFFEHLVVELLVKMGYGGSYKEAASIVGKSGDGGIDGIIKEDKLGLDAIYIQAKRWDSIVGRPEIQKFAGALLGQKARKGIFISTSSFTKDAMDFAKSIEAKIVLIDGSKLASLMIENELGVNMIRSYAIKRVDSDYFEEE